MTLVFLHGSGCTSVVWEQQLEFFEGSLALNFPGHPEGAVLDDVSALSAWLIETIKEKNLSDVVLVGHSLGSAVAMQAVLDEPQLFKGLILIGAGARLKVMPQLLSTLTDLVKTNAVLPDFLLAANQQIPEPFKSNINESIKANGVNVLLNDFTACDKFDVMDELAQLNIPTQVIVGDKDQMTPLKYASYLKELLPNARLTIIENATHMVFAERAELVNKTIQDFLTSVLSIPKALASELE